jgi:uncharacterized RDD family membrane protein YckC
MEEINRLDHPESNNSPEQNSVWTNIEDKIQEENEKDLYEDTVFPNLLTRVKALMIDVIVILVIFSMASIIIGAIGEVPSWIRGLIFIFSLYLYEPILITLFGGTVGHHVLKVNIKKLKNPELKLNIFQASLRFITKYLLGWLSFLTITGNKRRRAIHDMTSGSIVLYK